jgi:hypothetical protein
LERENGIAKSAAKWVPSYHDPPVEEIKETLKVSFCQGEEASIMV